jgi:hypothetical protein
VASTHDGPEMIDQPCILAVRLGCGRHRNYRFLNYTIAATVSLAAQRTNRQHAVVAATPLMHSQSIDCARWSSDAHSLTSSCASTHAGPLRGP